MVRDQRPSSAIREKAAGDVISRRIIEFGKGVPIAGIDVGEDFLDLAILDGGRSRLVYHRVPMAGIRRPVANSLAARMADAAPLLRCGAIAFVDSPRAPRDADCSGLTMAARPDAPAARLIDAALRAMLRSTPGCGIGALSMFPTPRADYFARCIASAACKPHLREIGEELLAPLVDSQRFARASIAGGLLFTRFMLAGFATFRALEAMGVRAFECFPDLQFRLWSDGVPLPSKRRRADALRVRQRVCVRLARRIGIPKFESPTTLDQADAAVLALSAAASAARRALIELRCAPEGRFAVGFSRLTSRESAGFKGTRENHAAVRMRRGGGN